MSGTILKSFGLFVMLTALLASPMLRADEGDVTMTIAPMYGLTAGESNTGLGGSLHLRYGVDDRFNLRATGFFDSQTVEGDTWSSFGGLLVGAGINMEVGEGQVIPYVFGDVGIAYLQDVDPPFALDLSFEIGFDYLITSTVAVGLAGRASLFVGEIPFDNAWLFNALFRLSFTF